MPKFRAIYCSRLCSSRAHRYLGPARDLEPTEAAWLAGLVDGEGSIVFPKPGSLHSLRLSVCNTYEPLMTKILEVVGTGSIVRKKYTNHYKDTFYWQCYGDNARKLIQAMLPWLIVKQERALLALSDSSPPNAP
jgi:hypothetical protein